MAIWVIAYQLTYKSICFSISLKRKNFGLTLIDRSQKPMRGQIRQFCRIVMTWAVVGPLTAILINDQRLWIANVGDSRAVLSKSGCHTPRWLFKSYKRTVLKI